VFSEMNKPNIDTSNEGSLKDLQSYVTPKHLFKEGDSSRL